MLKRMEGACDHQGDLSTPLVILPIDAPASPTTPANPPAAQPISFGTAPTGMEEDLQVATQAAGGLEVSPAPGQKRQRPDPEDIHEVARYEEEDALERRFGQVDARISHEVGKLREDIDKIGDKVEHRGVHQSVAIGPE